MLKIFYLSFLKNMMKKCVIRLSGQGKPNILIKSLKQDHNFIKKQTKPTFDSTNLRYIKITI